MKKHKYIFLLCLLAGIVIHSCKKDDEVVPAINFGYNYFPGGIGSYVIYEVDSIHYDDAGHFPHDTTRYQLKELIASTFTDNAGRPTLRIERYYKIYNDSVPYDSLPWIGPRVWTANKTTSTLEKKEENITFLKLVFSVKEGKKWNGNSFNSLGEKEYEIISADIAEIINAMNFDSVVTVKQFEQINIIEHRYEAEKYARNVGLICKEADSLYFGQANANDTPPFDDTSGYTVKQKIVSYVK